MPNQLSYLESFIRIQRQSMDATLALLDFVRPGVSELELAGAYHRELSQSGIDDFWYPTLICAGPWSGQPLTRRNHLPSGEVRLRQNDIVILDTTPFDAVDKTAWGNWTITKSIGEDDFYWQLSADILSLALQTAAEVLAGEYARVSDIYHASMHHAATLGLTSIDPRGNVGHSIFQVPPGQTVDETPLHDRLFIDAETHDMPLPLLLSLEPEMARVNPADGIRYGGKFQFILPFGCGEAGRNLLRTQHDFFTRLSALDDNPQLCAVWAQYAASFKF